MEKNALLAGLATILVASVAAAIVDSSTFTSANFGYDLYDIGVKKVVNGTIGFIAGVFCVICGAMCAIRGQMMFGLPCVFSGAIILNAEKIINSLGALI